MKVSASLSRYFLYWFSFISQTGSHIVFWKRVNKWFFYLYFYMSERIVFYFYLGWSLPQRCHFGYWMFCCLLLHFPSHPRRAIPRHSSCKLFLNWISDFLTIIIDSLIKDFLSLLLKVLSQNNLYTMKYRTSSEGI